MDFKYSPNLIDNDGNLQMTALQAVEAYDGIIKRICKAPGFWRADAIQELKLCVLEQFKLKKQRLNPAILINKLHDRFNDFASLERNRGIKNTDRASKAEIEYNVNKLLWDVEDIDDVGYKVKIHNHL